MCTTAVSNLKHGYTYRHPRYNHPVFKKRSVKEFEKDIRTNDQIFRNSNYIIKENSKRNSARDIGLNTKVSNLTNKSYITLPKITQFSKFLKVNADIQNIQNNSKRNIKSILKPLERNVKSKIIYLNKIVESESSDDSDEVSEKILKVKTFLASKSYLNKKDNEISKPQKKDENNELIKDSNVGECNAPNFCLQNRRHKKYNNAQRHKIIKINQLMSFNSGKLQSEYLKNEINKMLNIERQIENYKSKSIATKIFHPHKVLYLYKKKRIMPKFKSSLYKHFRMSKSEEKLAIIKSEGVAIDDADCNFWYSFLIVVDITEILLDDILSKGELLYIYGSENHCKITIKMNDVIINEGDERSGEILIESDSKKGLIKVLDKIDKVFPDWEIWKNGSIVN